MQSLPDCICALSADTFGSGCLCSLHVLCATTAGHLGPVLPDHGDRTCLHPQQQCTALNVLRQFLPYWMRPRLRLTRTPPISLKQYRSAGTLQDTAQLRVLCKQLCSLLPLPAAGHKLCPAGCAAQQQFCCHLGSAYSPAHRTHPNGLAPSLEHQGAAGVHTEQLTVQHQKPTVRHGAYMGI